MKYTVKSKLRKSRNIKKSRNLRKNKSNRKLKKTKASRKRILRLIRNKSGGGSGFAPWVGADQIHSANLKGETLASLEQPYMRGLGCLLMSCPENQW